MFEKYVINNEIFNNKNDITEKCRKIVARNLGKDLSGDDLNFMMQIFRYHEDNEKLIGAKRIYVDNDFTGTNNSCFYIEYITGEIDNISWTKCILRIPFGEKYKIDWKMPFGKYKGESLYEIYEKDIEYLKWISTREISRNLKIKINQMIRYGHIPYNPIAVKSQTKKNIDNLTDDKYQGLDYDNIDVDYEMP